MKSLRLSVLAALVPALFALPQAAMAQAFPSKPIRLIVGFAAGGVADTSARAVADRLALRVGQQVVVENRAGASGNIAAELVAKAEPDGHTLLVGFDGTMVVNPHTFSKLPFDTFRDFAPITKLGDAVLVVVAHPSVQANNMSELIAWSKANPNKLSYGSSGIGGTPHLAGELLTQRYGLNWQHVGYKGGGQAIIDVIAGQIPLVYTAVASSQQHVKAGKIKALGVSSSKRSASLPDVPTFSESGLPGFVVDSWTGLLAPAKTPRPVVDRLYKETAAVLGEPILKERYAVLGIEPVGNTPEQYAAQIRDDWQRWEKVVKTAGIKVD